METQTHENEISLREIIEILLKGWKPLVIVPLVVGIFTFCFSKYIMEPTYESQSIIQVHVSEGSRASVNTSSVDDILSSQSLTPEYSIESYIQQITSPEVLLPAIGVLNFETPYSYEQLRNKVAITPIKNSSLITLSVKDSDPEKAALIVNTVSETFINYVSGKQLERLDSSTELLEAQLFIEKDKLDQSLQATKTFDSMERNISNVSQELSLSEIQFNSTESALITLKETYEKSKFSLTQDIALSKEKIKAYKALLDDTSKSYQLNTNIFDSALTKELSSANNMPLEEQIEIMVVKDELNPVYVSTSETLAKEQITLIDLEKSLEKLTTMYTYNLKTLNEKSTNLETAINSLRSEVAELTYQKNLLDEELTISKNTYDAFNKKLESARVAKAANISESSVLWMSKGYVATKPLGPKVLLNTLIGIILAGMCVVFVLLFKHYWLSSAKYK
jgi:capsular polysaccharide biosynthesis protein